MLPSRFFVYLWILFSFAVLSSLAQREVRLLIVDDDNDSPHLLPEYLALLNSSAFASSITNITVWGTNSSDDQEPVYSDMASFNTILWFCGTGLPVPPNPGFSGPSNSSTIELTQWLEDGDHVLLLSCQNFLIDHPATTTFITDTLGISAFDPIAHPIDGILQPVSLVLQTLYPLMEFQNLPLDFAYYGLDSAGGTTVHPIISSTASLIVETLFRDFSSSEDDIFPIATTSKINSTANFLPSRTYFFAVEFLAIDPPNASLPLLEHLLFFNDTATPVVIPIPTANCSLIGPSCCAPNPVETYPCGGCNDSTIQTCVCQRDPYCCEEHYDGLCAIHARQFCGAVCLDCPQENCCVPNAGDFCGGCADAVMEECVCARDPFCCNTEYDMQCAALAETYCDFADVCHCTPSDCFTTQGSPAPCRGCIDPVVQECVCARSPYCCAVHWSDNCILVANQVCNGSDSSVTTDLTSVTMTSEGPVPTGSDGGDETAGVVVLVFGLVLAVLFLIILIAALGVLIWKRKSILRAAGFWSKLEEEH